ncbi:MAG: hydroxymethylbilane synthase [Proteobacteria bacterium]|nr:hydroxymethylbilane synthase [Pseudomonadota bacterium]
MPLPSITLASRQSPLALQQTETVANALRQRFSMTVHILPVSTRGDEITDRPLADAGGKALFIKGLQDAIASGRADAAVHSLKDMEAQPTPGFTLAAVGFAADARDVLICSTASALAELPPAAVVGTCSPRRAALVQRYYPHLVTKSIRGNLQTRLAKLANGEFNALLLAAAGLERLDLQQHIRAYLPLTEFIPAVGQGLLGLECASDNLVVEEVLSALDELPLRQRALAERTYAAAMGGNCHTALGAYASVSGAQVRMACFYAGDTGGFYQAKVSAPDAIAAGDAAAAAIFSQQNG